MQEKELAHLNAEEKKKLEQFLYAHPDAFDIPGRDFGCLLNVLYEADVRGPPVF